MIIAPCKDCKDRHINCHSVCEKYIEFKNQQAIANSVKRRELDLRAQDIDCAERRKRSRGSRK